MKYTVDPAMNVDPTLRPLAGIPGSSQFTTATKIQYYDTLKPFSMKRSSERKSVKFYDKFVSHSSANITRKKWIIAISQ